MTSGTTAQVLVEGGLTVTESPRWHDGALWFSDFFTRRVLRIDPGNGWALQLVCEVPGRPSGLGFMPDGELRVVSMDDCRLLAWSNNTLVTVASFGDRVSGPGNDMVIDRSGRAYIGNFGVDRARSHVARPTSLLMVEPDGTVAEAARNLVFPNGIVLDHNAGLLYVTETYRCRITVFDVGPDGALSGRRSWTEFAPDPGDYEIPVLTPRLPMIPDGIAIDAESHLWVADAKGHGVSRVSPTGAIVDFVDTGDRSAFAVALGGVDGRDLFICCAPPVETVDHAQARRGAILHTRVAVGALA